MSIMFYNKDEPSWVRIEISALGRRIDGRGDGERIIVYLGGTFHAIPEELLTKNKITLKVGLFVEVEFIDSGIVNIRMPEDEQNIELIAS